MFIENTEELAHNKLLLLYIISKSQEPMSNQEIVELVLKNNYMNYFLIQQYLSELNSSDFLEIKEINNKKTYNMLDKGKMTLRFFEDRINQTMRSELLAELGVSETDTVQESKELIGEYYSEGDNNFIVNLKLREGSITLFSLYLNLPNEEQAKEICDNWKKNPEYIYKNIINLVVGVDIAEI